MFYSGRHLVSFDGKDRILNIDIELGCSSDLKKDLEIRLTDDDDFCFLYFIRITVDEFTEIKQQQGLLINFNEFEQKVADLLCICSQEEAIETPKYGLRFSRNTEERDCGLLQIIEATNFKYLHHLSLNLYAADDEKLKLFLASRLKKHKAESDAIIRQLSHSVSELTSSLKSAEEGTKLIKDEFQAFKVACSAKELSLRSENEFAIRELQSKHDEVKTKLEESLSKEKDLANQIQEELQKDFKSRLDLALNNNKNLRDQQSVLQTRVETLQEKLKFAETENISLTEDIKIVRSQLDTTNRAYDLQTEMANQLQSKISILEENMITKGKQILDLENSLTKEHEQKLHLLEQSEQHCRNIQNLEKHLASNTEEINKSNEIIKRLQSEVKSFQTKAKLRGQVAAEQERLLVSKDSEIQRLHTELDKLRSEITNVKKLNTQIVEEHDQTLQGLTDAQKTIKSNEIIIAWLNRQIAENDSDYVQNRLKLSAFPVISVSSGVVGPPPTINSLTVVSSGSEKPSAFETTPSYIPLTQNSQASHVVPLFDTHTSVMVSSSSNSNILQTVDKRLIEAPNSSKNNLYVKIISSAMDNTNLPSTVLTTHLPISTSSCVIPKENSELFRVTDTLNYPYSGSCIPPEIPDTLTTESADRNGKSRNIFDQKISSTKCLETIDYTNDQNYHQQSLASAYFPQVSL
ncbi:Spindle assembly abnormal protein 6, variant 2 [Schistosoma haematobium]|uniref:Spindle assembly abnormal protein 6, variant 2 n=2 Tax=Schistosoma haematobium TaxID=6185 RepID=A0A922LPY7_SCHHA|nr:Spindle assembly abnormal protein 6, variant 2 [Schistosoma haematobium]KAH9591075.1 Spindle assembly abnormal protein 6, variant 2 [Schistosoma haematobium]